MTSAQLILVSVTSALVAVFAMLLVATIKRARSKDDQEKEEG
jgi:Mn2+/Fe2+ NRAMP family transporter